LSPIAASAVANDRRISRSADLSRARIPITPSLAPIATGRPHVQPTDRLAKRVADLARRLLDVVVAADRQHLAARLGVFERRQAGVIEQFLAPHVADRSAARRSRLRRRKRLVGQHPNSRSRRGLRQETVVAGQLVELR
jgi:hypothetical protein